MIRSHFCVTCKTNLFYKYKMKRKWTLLRWSFFSSLHGLRIQLIMKLAKTIVFCTSEFLIQMYGFPIITIKWNVGDKIDCKEVVSFNIF